MQGRAARERTSSIALARIVIALLRKKTKKRHRRCRRRRYRRDYFLSFPSDPMLDASRRAASNFARAKGGFSYEGKKISSNPTLLPSSVYCSAA